MTSQHVRACLERSKINKEREKRLALFHYFTINSSGNCSQCLINDGKRLLVSSESLFGPGRQEIHGGFCSYEAG